MDGRRSFRIASSARKSKLNFFDVTGLAIFSVHQSVAFDRTQPTIQEFGFSRYAAACIGALASMEKVMLAGSRVLSHTECAIFRQSYFVYRSSFNVLAGMALARNVCRYRLRHKSHQLGHICYHFLPRNPRYFSNYLDEDFIGKTKGLAESAHLLHMSKHVLMRYCIGMCLKLWNGEF